MKLCLSCNTEKSKGNFGIRRASPDGLCSKCKQCQSTYDKKRAMLPHRVEARAVYAKTDEGKAAGSKAKKAWSDRNAIKRGATTIVNNALRDGKLCKSNNCESCDREPNRLHGHHDDYAFPLCVRWLCPGCHSSWHRKNGEGANAH